MSIELILKSENSVLETIKIGAKFEFLFFGGSLTVLAVSSLSLPPPCSSSSSRFT